MKPYEVIEGHRLVMMSEEGRVAQLGNSGVIVDRLGDYVLSFVGENTYQPWVTHRLCPEGQVIWGHYFQELSDARASLIDRYQGNDSRGMDKMSEKNRDRAKRSKLLLLRYKLEQADPQPVPGELDSPEAIMDLLADLQHFCDAEGLDYIALEEQARAHYDAEVSEEES